MFRWSLMLLLLAGIASPSRGQSDPYLLYPSTQSERAMVYPLGATQWSLLQGSGISTLHNFGSSAEIAATP
ncbi:MAG: hypothetical protein KDC38_18605, partial [Planctomycetes bacterium]|nr:hypothetical protein [Planctomycetota bacterium]